MTISERDKKLLLFLALIAIIGLPIAFIIRPLLDKQDAIKTEIGSLNDRNNYLQNLVDNQEEYKAQIEQFSIQKEEILSRYPSELPQEGTYQFIYNTEQSIPIELSDVTFDISRIDTSSLDNSTTAQENANATGEESTQTEGTEENAAAPVEGTDTAVTPVDEISPANVYLLVSENNKYTFSAGYTDFKAFLKHIKYYDERMVITKMSVDYEGDKDEVNGSFEMTHYAILGSDKDGTKYVNPGLSQGTSNIFMKRTTTMVAGDESYNNPNFFVMLCQPEADVNAKTVGQSADSSEKTYISSDSNDKQDIKITFEGSNGNYTATYSIGGKKLDEKISFSQSGPIVLEIISSPRVGDNDKVSADIGVVNKSDTDVAAVIRNDDKEKPRVKLTGKIASILER